MRTLFRIVLVALFSIAAFVQAGAQEQTSVQDQTNAQSTEHVPIYRITVVARTIKAINYRHRSGSTKVEFKGTSLMPDARGTADVQSKQGVIHVDAEMNHMQSASKFGPENLTYVLWAISPEGRPVNLGEVLLDGSGKSKLNVTSDLQSFGLIVTAEPYFAVTRPSDVVVMENFVTNETNGTVEEVDAKYELLRRGQYTASVAPAALQPMVMDPKTPLEVYEARNAVRIAKWAGADHYASDTLQKAELDLRNAEDFLASKNGDRKALITDAREAAQMAEDARLISVTKEQEEQQAEAARATSEAKKQAEQASSQAEQARLQAEEAKQQKAQAEAAKQSALAEQQRAQAEAESARGDAEQAQQQAQQAEQEKAELRAKLLRQLNDVLQTRDTARGLVVNMSDVLFDSGKYTLKPVAREKLAKVAGVLLAYPGLKVEVDGYTDNVGGEELNETLSQKRADAVRDYLLQQGIPPDSLKARGFGEDSPIASNDTSIGRQLNRRVELVLSGQMIGAAVSPNAAASQHGGDRVAGITGNQP